MPEQENLREEKLLQRHDCWNNFQNEKSRINGRWEYKHACLQIIRRGIMTLIYKGVLFAYLDSALFPEGLMYFAKGMFEGGVSRGSRKA